MMPDRGGPLGFGILPTRGSRRTENLSLSETRDLLRQVRLRQQQVRSALESVDRVEGPLNLLGRQARNLSSVFDPSALGVPGEEGVRSLGRVVTWLEHETDEVGSSLGRLLDRLNDRERELDRRVDELR